MNNRIKMILMPQDDILCIVQYVKYLHYHVYSEVPVGNWMRCASKFLAIITETTTMMMLIMII